ncbi:unnamed protein product [Cunninghamella blakesleeana]
MLSSLITLSCLSFTIVTAAEPLIRVPITKEYTKTPILSKRDTYQAPIYNFQQSQYLVQVSIGTPAQNFTLTVDTGSSDLWVPSVACPISNCPVNRFDPNKSSTFKASNTPLSITYGKGAVNGTYASDTVTIGSISVQQQQIGLASYTESIFLDVTSTGQVIPIHSDDNSVSANGILGLGFPGLTKSSLASSQPYNPFVFNLVEQKLIQQHVFSIYLNSVDSKGWSGEIIFGGIDPSKFTGEISYAPVPKTPMVSGDAIYGYWAVPGQGFHIQNGKGPTSNIRYKQPVATIIDTGSTLSYLPYSVAQPLLDAITGPGNNRYDQASGLFVVDCNLDKQNTILQVQFATSTNVTETPVVINANVNDMVYDAGNAGCVFGIGTTSSAISLSENLLLIGDSILRNAYMVFDMDQKRIGFAQSKYTTGNFNNADPAGGQLGNNNMNNSNSNNNGNGGTNNASSFNHLSVWYILGYSFIISYLSL